MASFISLLIVFLLRAYSTHGLLEIDFHPAWMLLNLGLIFVEIAMLFKLEHWVLPGGVCHGGKAAGHGSAPPQKIKLSFKQVLFFLLKDCPCVVHGLFSFPFCGRFYYIVPHYDIIRVMIILGLWPVAA